MIAPTSRHEGGGCHVPGPSYSPIMQGKKGSKTSQRLGPSPYQQGYPQARFFSSIVYGPHHYVESATKRDTESFLSTEGTSPIVPALRQSSSRNKISLPSISDLVGLSEDRCRDTAATILERLKSDQSHIEGRQVYPDDK